VDSAGADSIVWHDEFIALPTKYNLVTKQVYADFADPDTIANVACYYEIIFAYSDYAHQTFPPLLVSPSNNADSEHSML